MTDDAAPTATRRPRSGPHPSDSSAGPRRVPALDGLRGLAVLAVIAFHADLLPGGYLGVDLFFVLSGYLITSLLLREHRRDGRIGLADFWTRRARRLLPALLVVIAVTAALTLSAGATARAAFAADATGALVYLANWRAIGGGGGYWSQYAAPSLLEHTWSLAIEEQFYLLWPLVAILALGRRASARTASTGGRDPDRGARRLLVVSLVGAAASGTLMVGWSLAGGDPDRLYLGTDTRAAGILLGSALACVGDLRRAASVSGSHRRVIAGAGWVGAAGLALAWWRLEGHSTWLYRGGFLVCGLAAAAVISAVTVLERGRLARLLTWRPLVAAGLVSYGLYLWHWPIFVWLDEQRVGWSGAPLLALQLGLTVALTLLSYRFVEMPVRRGAFALRPALAVGAAMAAVGVFVAIVAVPEAPPLDAPAAAAGITALGPLAPAPPGPTSSPSTRATQVGDPAPPRVLIAGDSVAAAIAEGVLPYQSQFGIEARSVAVVGCGIARDNPRVRFPDGREIDESHCLGTTTTWSSEVEAWRPDVVLIVLGWPGQTERFVDGAWRRPCDPSFDRWYQAEVSAAIDAAGRAGSRVAIATTPYYRPPSGSDDSDASTDCLNDTYRAAAVLGGSVTVVDLADHLCPSHRCARERDGVELRPDGLHFTGPSSVWAADWLLRDHWRAVAAPIEVPVPDTPS